MSRRFGVTVDCGDPATLAAFWAAVLGYVEEPPPAGFADWAEYDAAHGITADEAAAGMTIVDPDGDGPRLYFQRVPEAKIAKNRVHLDVRAGDIAGAVEQATTLGGRVIGRSADPADPFVTLADPEGNEFCLVP